MSDAPGVVVVGAGVAGLAAAHRVGELAGARGRAVPVTVLEAGTRVGGAVGSERVDGFLLEHGADSFLSEKPWALDLCRRLGLEDRMIGTQPAERRTYVVQGGRLHPLPDGFLLMAPTRLWPLAFSPLFTWRGKLRMLADLVLPRGNGGDETLAAFVRRRLGSEALARVAQPLVGGIYTADPERLSLAATMPRFLEMERVHRSIILAMRRQARTVAAGDTGARWSLFVSFRDGMQTLVDALAARLPAGTVRLGARVVGLDRAGAGWRVRLADGGALGGGAVVLAAPAWAAAELVAPHDRALADGLAAIRYATSATINLAYDRRALPRTRRGFGFVVPAAEGRSIIACSYADRKFEGRAPADGALIRVFCGGELAEQVTALPDGELVAAARRDLQDLLGIRAGPRFTRLVRWPRSMPQYAVGHRERVDGLEAAAAALRGLVLAGAAYRGVGVPDCVHSGEAAAARALEVLDL